MPLSDIEFILSSGGALLLVLTLVQVSPIKIDPWTSLAKAIGRAINSDITSKFDDLDKKIDKLEENIVNLRAECDEREATLCRTHILRFGDEILHGTKHSQEHFKSILVDISTYEDYCSTHPLYLNNLAEVTIDLIKKTYKECFEQKNFL